jgi:hypothetical protein
LILPAAAFVGPVIGGYSSVLTHRFYLHPSAEALTGLSIAGGMGVGKVELVG